MVHCEWLGKIPSMGEIDETKSDKRVIYAYAIGYLLSIDILDFAIAFHTDWSGDSGRSVPESESL